MLPLGGSALDVSGSALTVAEHSLLSHVCLVLCDRERQLPAAPLSNASFRRPTVRTEEKNRLLSPEPMTPEICGAASASSLVQLLEWLQGVQKHLNLAKTKDV